MSSPIQPSPEPGSSASFALEIERLLETFAMRVVLSVSIIVSLLPLSWAEQLDPLFLLVFGSEFLLRLFIVLVAPARGAVDTGLTGDKAGALSESKHSRVGAWSLLVIDFIALISFIPMKVGSEGARWLRLFRLTRMLLLVGYWAPLVRDLWSIMARGERARQIVLMAVVVSGLSFAGAVFVHHIGATIDADGDGDMTSADKSFWSLLWWAFRQVQDPGNLMASPAVVPLLLVSMALTLFGLFLVSFLIGLGTDVVAELLELSRLRPAGLRQHTVVVGVNASTPRLLTELMRYYRKLIPSEARVLSGAWFVDLKRRGFRLSRYLVVGRSEEPPEFLRQPELSRIVYREHSEQDDVLVARADLLAARRVLLLADAEDPNPDHHTIQTLVTLVERMEAGDQTRQRRVQDRERVLIAEIVDESNVAAAKAALRVRRDTMRAFVVPTERLLALFVAGVVRRPGLGAVLEELLTSSGHEMYTCFFDAPGLGFRLKTLPRLPKRPADAVEALVRRGLRSKEELAVVPLGLLTACAADDPRDFEVCVNPGPNTTGNGDCLGFVAVADGFASIRAFTESLVDDPVGADPELVPGEGDGVDAPPPSAFRRSPQTPVDMVLVCGFRPGTIYVIEELVRGNPGAQVLVLVADEERLAAAREAFEAHSALVARGLMPPMHTAFSTQDDGTYVVAGDTSTDPARVHLAAADWVASRHLVDLPCDFGHVADLDVIILTSDGKSDARISTALLKLEALLAAAGAEPGKPRVVAEVGDGRLAARLQQHCEKAGKHHIRIYSTQQLRAFFLFQSVVVPGFDAVYSELLGSWGQSFVRLLPKKKLNEGECTFAELAISLWSAGNLLIGVEVFDDDGRRHLCIAPGAGERGSTIQLSKLRCAWVIAADKSATAARRSHSTLLDPPAAQ